jgi:hypothetical protein
VDSGNCSALWLCPCAHVCTVFESRQVPLTGELSTVLLLDWAPDSGVNRRTVAARQLAVLPKQRSVSLAVAFVGRC